MKLNNHGWELPKLLICVCIILVALSLAALSTLRYNSFMNGNNTKTTDETKKVLDSAAKNYYSEKAGLLSNAAQKYINNENIIIDIGDYKKIDISTLKDNGYITSINDYYTGNSCNGYAMVTKNTSGILDIDSYINCDNYKTEGYR